MPLTFARAVAALAAAALVPGLAVGLGSSVAQAGLPLLCDGKPATIVGTEDDDFLSGTDGPDVIVALGGRDQVDAYGGDDTVCGGAGDDTLSGWAGNDRLFGEDDGDLLIGYEGDDRLGGGPASDTIFGSAGDDELRGGDDPDTLGGDAGADLIVGGESGSDLVVYDDRVSGVVVDLRGGGGPNDGSDHDGPEGARDTIRHVEHVLGTVGGDEIFGNGQANHLVGESGQDLVDGRRGDDSLFLRDGEADTANCGNGRDSVRLDAGVDTISDCEVKGAG